MNFIDTHIDTLWQMEKSKRQFHQNTDIGHVDLYRAQQAGLLCGFFTGFPTETHEVTESMLRLWILMVNDPKNKMTKITNYNEFETLENKWKNCDTNDREIGVVMHFEGAAGIDPSLNRLYIYYEAGLRSMGLTWNEQNQFATGQEQGEDRGVTKLGLDLLAALEDLGVIIDVSHLNDKSFWDVINNTNCR